MKGSKLRTVISAVMLLAFLLTGCAGAGASQAKSGTLRVGVRDDIMNFGYQNRETGRYFGLEIDLAYKLAEELGYKDVELVTVQPENRKEKLQNGEVDCLIAAYSIAETRLKNFDFSEPYYTDSIRVMVEDSSMFEHIDDLKDKTVGVLAGANTAILCAIEMNRLGLIPDFDQSAFNPITFDGGVRFWRAEHYSDLDTALEDGTVDAVCMDGCIAQTYMEKDRRYLAETFAEQQYGVATQKGSRLSGPVADAIRKMSEDGTIDALIDKWN